MGTRTESEYIFNLNSVTEREGEGEAKEWPTDAFDTNCFISLLQL